MKKPVKETIEQEVLQRFYTIDVYNNDNKLIQDASEDQKDNAYLGWIGEGPEKGCFHDLDVQYCELHDDEESELLEKYDVKFIAALYDKFKSVLKKGDSLKIEKTYNYSTGNIEMYRLVRFYTKTNPKFKEQEAVYLKSVEIANAKRLKAAEKKKKRQGDKGKGFEKTNKRRASIP